MAKKQETAVVENQNDWKLVHIMGHGKTRLNTATENYKWYFVMFDYKKNV